VISQTGAPERVARMIAERTGRALAALSAAPMAGPARQALVDLAGKATRRSS